MHRPVHIFHNGTVKILFDQLSFFQGVLRLIPQIAELLRIRFMVVKFSILHSMVIYNLISAVIIHGRINIIMRSQETVIEF